MACGAPLVTLDKYEIKRELRSLNNMESLAYRLIDDIKFRKDFIARNLKYVRDVHSGKAVARTNISNINKFLAKNKT